MSEQYHIKGAADFCQNIVDDFCESIRNLLYAGHTLIFESELREDGRWFRARLEGEDTRLSGWRICPEHALWHLEERLGE